MSSIPGFAENQTVGTVVGEFNATDPDANASLTYHFVSGAGDTHTPFSPSRPMVHFALPQFLITRVMHRPTQFASKPWMRPIVTTEGSRDGRSI